MIDFGYIFIVILVIFFSMTVHEFMHGYIAYLLGDDTAKHQGRLTLNPLKHIDPFMTIILPVALAIMNLPIFGGAKPVAFNPNNIRHGEWGVALVAISGPLVNLILGFLSTAVLVLFFSNSYGTTGFTIFQTAALVNLGFFVFNMLPIPPLDGSRFLYALAPDSARRVMEMIERYGVFVVFAIVLFFSNYIGSFMGSAITGIYNAFLVILGVK